MLKKDIDQLKTIFLQKKGGVVSGAIRPNETDKVNLGSAEQRFNRIYAKEVIADNLSGGTGGGTASNADTVDNYHANITPTPNNLLPLDSLGQFPSSTYGRAFLSDGSRTLDGNLVTTGSIIMLDERFVDGVDISEHNHNGQDGSGARINHRDLLNLDADDHPQYPQRDVDEIISGSWMFTDYLDRSVGWKFLPKEHKFQAVPYNMTFLADVNHSQC